MYCRKCRYELRGLRGPACPECGRPFDPSEPRTYDGAPSRSRVCTAFLIGGAAGYVALLAWSLTSHGTVILGDVLTLIAAMITAYLAGWWANLRLAFLVHGGAFAFMAIVLWCFDTEFLLPLGSHYPYVGEFVLWFLACLVITIGAWAAGRLGWYCRRGVHRWRLHVRERGGGLLAAWKKKWYRPRNLTLGTLAVVLTVGGWIAVEVARVLAGDPVVAVDYGAAIEALRQRLDPADEVAAQARWEALLAALDRFDVTLGAIDDAGRARVAALAVEQRRHGWDDGAVDFGYVLTEMRIPDAAERERAALAALRADGGLDAVERLVVGPPARGRVTLDFQPYGPGHLATCRSVARAWAASMRFAAEAGDDDRLVRDFEALLGLGETLGANGGILDEMTGVAIVALGAGELRDELMESDLDEALCRRLLAALDAWQPTSAELLLERERAVYLDMIQRTCTDDGRGGGYWIPRAGHALAGTMSNSAWEDVRDAFLSRFARPTRRERVELCDEIVEARRAGVVEVPARWRGAIELDDVEETLRDADMPWLASVWMTADFLEPPRYIEKTLAVTRLMLAIELFEAVRGRLPTSLDELVPEFTKELPVDPATGAPFGYVRRDVATGDQPYDLYTYGPDGVDDGGRFRTSVWMSNDLTGLDVQLTEPRAVYE